MRVYKRSNVFGILRIERRNCYYEKDMEQAIITHLQEFLLEIGNGFSFVVRQKKIHSEGD